MAIPISEPEAEILGLALEDRARALDRLIASIESDAHLKDEWITLALQN